MLAAVFKSRGVLQIEDRPEPGELAEDEVLLEVEGCGVCGTDLHILSDPPGHPATEGVILGHEIVARIVDKGAKVREFDIGTRVLVVIGAGPAGMMHTMLFNAAGAQVI